MSVAAKKWVRRHSPAKGSARTVLGELAWAGDNAGRGARLSHGQLVKATGLSRATVQRALLKLELDDLIRRHRGCTCNECKRAERGVVVFDVVMPEQPEEASAPGQMTLLAGIPGDLPQVRQVVRPIAEDHQPHCEAGSGLTVRHLEEREDVKQQQQQLENARERKLTGQELVERVISTLQPTGLFVARYAIEGALAPFIDRPELVEDALADVVALATDPAYRPPKGGAAKVLLIQLRAHQNAPTSPAPRYAPRPATRPAAELDERFTQYDVAAGLAS